MYSKVSCIQKITFISITFLFFLRNRKLTMFSLFLNTTTKKFDSPYALNLGSYELLLKSKIYLNETLSSTINVSNESSSSANISDAKYEKSWCFVTILTVFNIILSFLCINNNSFILWIVFNNKRMQTVTNYFLSNLAVADIIIGVFVAPFQVNILFYKYNIIDLAKYFNHVLYSFKRLYYKDGYFLE